MHRSRRRPMSSSQKQTSQHLVEKAPAEQRPARSSRRRFLLHGRSCHHSAARRALQSGSISSPTIVLCDSLNSASGHTGRTDPGGGKQAVAGGRYSGATRPTDHGARADGEAASQVSRCVDPAPPPGEDVMKRWLTSSLCPLARSRPSSFGQASPEATLAGTAPLRPKVTGAVMKFPFNAFSNAR